MVKILRPNETPQQELQRDFTEELKSQMKKAAKKLRCPVEQLKYRVGNDGVVEISMMSVHEMEDRIREEIVNKKVIAIKKARGRFYA